MIDNHGILVAILPPIAGCLAFFALFGIIVFILMARNKRSLHGTYSPQNEEFKAPIIEMKDMLKDVQTDERFKERLI